MWPNDKDYLKRLTEETVEHERREEMEFRARHSEAIEHDERCRAINRDREEHYGTDGIRVFPVDEAGHYLQRRLS
jgi:hypothetical protein